MSKTAAEDLTERKRTMIAEALRQAQAIPDKKPSKKK